VFTLLSLGAIVVTVASSYANTLAGQVSSRTYHEALVRGILRAPMGFFDITPLGRVVNRFSKDISVLDDRLPATLYMWLSTLCSCVVAVAVISFVVPWFLVACLPMALVYRKIMLMYVPTSRELQRLESVTRSPIFSHFTETLEGASTVSADLLDAGIPGVGGEKHWKEAIRVSPTGYLSSVLGLRVLHAAHGCRRSGYAPISRSMSRPMLVGIGG
jgi:ABC-type multidrug transport system fused ATPase/permease subunit